MSLKAILTVAYFVVSLALIVWSEVVSQAQSELGLLGVGIFSLITFPSSFLVGHISSYLSSLIWQGSAPWYIFKLDLALILIAGYLQWFRFAPWVLKKLRGVF